MKRLMMICCLALTGCQSEEECISEMRSDIDGLEQMLRSGANMSDDARQLGLRRVQSARTDIVIINTDSELDACDYEAVGGVIRLKN